LGFSLLQLTVAEIAYVMSTVSSKSAKQKNHTAPSPTASRIGNRHEGLSDAITGLTSAMKKVAKFNDELTEFDNLRHDISVLKAGLAEKEEKSNELRTQLDKERMEKDVLVKAFAKQAIQWQKDQDQCTANLQNLKKNAQETSSRQLKAQERQAQETERKFEHCKSELHELNGHIGMTKSPSTLLVSC
jgi:chromosome segregation ATPase